MLEALGRAWALANRGEAILSTTAWISVVAMNLGRSGIRRLVAERRARVASSFTRTERDVHETTEERLDVMQAIRMLPRRQREVIALRYFVDLDIAEIASALQASEGSVRVALHAARHRLASTLALQDPEEANDHA